MEDILLGGPQTIGALASARPVAKQYIQKLVSDLVALDMVIFKPNPNDRRSKIVELTKAGNAALLNWHESEFAVMRGFVAELDQREVVAAEALLSRLNEALQQKLIANSNHQKRIME